MYGYLLSISPTEELEMSHEFGLPTVKLWLYNMVIKEIWLSRLMVIKENNITKYATPFTVIFIWKIFKYLKFKLNILN
jgi:hypothetical protein